MLIKDFIDAIEKHDDLEGMDIRDNKLYVRNKQTNQVCSISFECIEDNSLSVLQDILEGKREPEALYQMSRVVGYFSRIDNWNDSKKGELKDRQKGNYNVS